MFPQFFVFSDCHAFFPTDFIPKVKKCVFFLQCYTKQNCILTGRTSSLSRFDFNRLHTGFIIRYGMRKLLKILLPGSRFRFNVYLQIVIHVLGGYPKSLAITFKGAIN